MIANFATALRFTLQSEGGYANNVNDPGGPTMEGITLATFRVWEGDQSLTSDDLKAIDADTVAAIYKQQYWDRTQGDALPNGVDLMCFDFGVNAGTGRAARELQSAVRTAVDGIIGPMTLQGVKELDPLMLIDRLTLAERVFYRGLSTYDTFGNGWENRTTLRQRLAIQLATSAAVAS